jgi:hypothetical protein
VRTADGHKHPEVDNRQDHHEILLSMDRNPNVGEEWSLGPTEGLQEGNALVEGYQGWSGVAASRRGLWPVLRGLPEGSD